MWLASSRAMTVNGRGGLARQPHRLEPSSVGEPLTRPAVFPEPLKRRRRRLAKTSEHAAVRPVERAAENRRPPFERSGDDHIIPIAQVAALHEAGGNRGPPNLVEPREQIALVVPVGRDEDRGLDGKNAAKHGERDAPAQPAR